MKLNIFCSVSRQRKAQVLGNTLLLIILKESNFKILACSR